MRWPLCLRRVRTGPLTFPLHGKQYVYIPAPHDCFYGINGEVKDIALLTWLRASKQLFEQKREQDNMAIITARREAWQKWKLHLVLTALTLLAIFLTSCSTSGLTG